MAEQIDNGTRRELEGGPYIYYDGYWIKYYEPPSDSLAAKKRLIEALTRRLFNHVEHGINIPGPRLEEARRAYEDESDPARKRVKGAMLAGALFNRAADVFTKLVELQECGVAIAGDNPLLHECGRCLLEALEFGKTVRDRSGDAGGVDELWGEPFKAFSMSVEAFYESRYVKIAQTMRDIDRITEALVHALASHAWFHGIEASIRAFGEAAKRKCETLRTDPVIFEVWPSFVVAGEQLLDFAPKLPADVTDEDRELSEQGLRLLAAGKELLTDVARARVPMPKRTRRFLDRCDRYRRRGRKARAA